MKNLISMLDFIYKVGNNKDERNIMSFKDDLAKIYNYAQFLKRPLELGMFVPCDEYGNVLEEPEVDNYPFGDKEMGSYRADLKQYQQAKERCLFLGQRGEVFDYEFARIFIDEFFNIDQLSNEIRNIQLTQTAIKQIGL